MDYLECNLLWAADIHQTKLEDGSVWETVHWIDLHSLCWPKMHIRSIFVPSKLALSCAHS
jgi:hypothetical protein